MFDDAAIERLELMGYKRPLPNLWMRNSQFLCELDGIAIKLKYQCQLYEDPKQDF